MLIVSPTLFFILFSYLFTLSFPPKSQSKSSDLDHKYFSQGARLGVWSKPILAVPLFLPVTHCGTSLPPPAHIKATRASVWAVRHLPGPQESLCTYRVCGSRSGKIPKGPPQLSVLPVAALSQIRHFLVAVIKTPNTSFWRTPCRSLISGTLNCTGGQECAQRAPWLSSLVENLVQTAVTSQ